MRALFLILLLILPTAGCEAQDTVEREALVIETAAGERHSFRVEIADEPAEQRLGLMFRTDMAADHGMLFPYDPPRDAVFWMKNTKIPLDMIFIAAGGRIVHIETAEPETLTRRSAGQPVAGVLELNGGTAERLGIGIGDRAVHPALDRR